MSGGFIQILMTRFSDLVTGNSLKRWLQRDSLPRSQVEATTQAQANRAKIACPISGRKSRVAGERRVKNMQCRENLRRARMKSISQLRRFIFLQFENLNDA